MVPNPLERHLVHSLRRREGVYYLITDQPKLDVNMWLHVHSRRLSVRHDSLGLRDPMKAAAFSSVATLYALGSPRPDRTPSVSGYDPSVVKSKAMASPFNPDLSLVFARPGTEGNGASKKMESKSNTGKVSVFHRLGPAIAGMLVQ